MAPPATVHSARLLHVDVAARRFADRALSDLPALFVAGDLLVVNDAATLPASLFGHGPRGQPIEVRLVSEQPDGTWQAVLFGAGDWRTPTERRAAPPLLAPGDTIAFQPELAVEVVRVAALSPRLCDLRFTAPSRDMLWRALYAHGHPVQYAHETAELPLARVQTPYATRPWAAEMPSAGRPLGAALRARLGQRGVRFAALTHAAGLSATGDPALDAALPLPERYDLPAATVRAIAEAQGAGGRVVAVGTSVVRALEGCFRAHGRLVAGPGVTDLTVTEQTEIVVVSGLLSGVHAAESSHFRLLQAFMPGPLGQRYVQHVTRGAYRGHEFGDTSLILSAGRATL
jgi:S-adenosylmethionine:tRNA ribosyltransferase-isomerase